MIHLRPDGDLQVEFHLPKQRGSPFEQLFVIPEETAEEALDEAARFVSRLLAEDLVLGWDARVLRGGRRFVSPLEARQSTHFAWTASGRGTYDTPPS